MNHGQTTHVARATPLGAYLNQSSGVDPVELLVEPDAVVDPRLGMLPIYYAVLSV
jgi:hypothetical protein